MIRRFSAGIVTVTWGLGLVAFSGYGALNAFGGQQLPEGQIATVAAVLAVGIGAVGWLEGGGRHPVIASGLRGGIILLLSLWLTWSLFLPRARRAAYEAESVTMRTEAVTGAEVPLSPFASGVETMDREAHRGVDEAWVPLVLLTWLASIPGLRALANATERPSEPAGV